MMPSSMSTQRTLVLVSATCLGLMSATPCARVSWPPAIHVIESPAGARSAQPHLAVSDRGIILSWIESAADRATLKYAERIASGWSPARTVASGTDWFVNWADIPSVVRLDDGTLAAHWLQRAGPETYAYDVRLSYSKDDGDTWSPSFTPHTDGTKTEHGFASLFQMPGAGLGLVWLDGRAMKPQSGHGDHGGDAGPMSVRFATFSRQWKPDLEAPVDLRVCECCPTTVAVTADGPIAAFRNRTDDEVRDIYIARFENGKWGEPKPVHDDGWKIAACPVNGPMLSARGRDVVIAWFTATGGVGKALLAFSHDSGRTFGPPIRLDDAGSLGRVDVELLADGSAVASWIEFANQRAQFRFRRVERSGNKSGALTVSALAGSRASGYPRLALHGSELLFAWTETAQDGARVKTAAARMH